jgi:hypothetical protein
VPVAEHRKQPAVADKVGDDLFDDGIPPGLLAIEVVVERSLGDVRGGENGIDAGTLKTASVDLPKSCTQQAFPGTLWITEPSLPVVST